MACPSSLERDPAIDNNIEELEGHYANQNKSDTERKKCPITVICGNVKSTDAESRMVVTRRGEREEMGDVGQRVQSCN